MASLELAIASPCDCTAPSCFELVRLVRSFNLPPRHTKQFRLQISEFCLNPFSLHLLASASRAMNTIDAEYLCGI